MREMLNREEAGGKAPETARGSLEDPRVNKALVENFLGLLASFSAFDRAAIISEIIRLCVEPEWQVQKSSASSHTTLKDEPNCQTQLSKEQSCGPQTDRSKTASPEKENSPTPPLAGWLSSRPSSSSAAQPGTAAIVDLCKRIEFCYQEYQRHHRQLSRLPYIDFRATQALALEIINHGGLSSLVDYVEHLERTFQSQGWAGFDRPERMRQHWQSYIQKKENQPASH